MQNKKLLPRLLNIGIAVFYTCFSLVPTASAQPACGWIDISAGENHMVAVRQDGTVWTWGLNNYGQLGDGTTTTRTTPVQVPGLTDVFDVDGGYYYTMARKNDGSVWAWGINSSMQLGTGSASAYINTPVQSQGLQGLVVDDIAAGWGDSHILDGNGYIWSWGDNSHGELGIGNFTDQPAPVQVTSVTNITDVNSNYDHTLALRNDGAVFAWGTNSYGEFGTGDTTWRSSPFQVPSLTGSVISDGAYVHSLFADNLGNARAAGWNLYGQLGNGSNTDSLPHVASSGLNNVTELAGGLYHSVALKNDGTVWTYGRNNDGQLGNGNNTDSNVPVQVTALSGITKISAGGWQSYAMDANGNLWAWGDNTYGQLGDGSLIDSNVPVQIPAPGCTDTDSDTVLDVNDNCPTVANPAQENSDVGGFIDTIYYTNYTLDGIWRMNADGSNKTQINTDSNAFNPHPNNDGSKIVYVSNDGDPEIYVMNADGTGQTKLTNNTATDNNPSFSADGTQIVFSSDRAGNNEIYKMNSDGTNVVRLTTNAAAENSPAFSPDGTQIIFSSDRDHINGEIYKMNSDGTGVVRLTNNTSVDIPGGFSPDGTKIVYSQAYDLATMNADGTNQQVILTSPDTIHSASYSPDGTRIAFTAVPSSYVVYIVNENGTNLLALTSGAQVNGDSQFGTRYDNDGLGDACDCQDDTLCTATAYCISEGTPDPQCPHDNDGDGLLSDVDNCPTVANPGQENTDYPIATNLTNNFAVADIQQAVNPDGRQIAFATDRDDPPNFEIYTMDTNGTSLTNITNNIADDREPVYSPDGTKILFLSNRDGNQEVYIMNNDGTGLVNLSNNTGTDSSHKFSPDGTKVLFESDFEDANGEIYVVNIDGTARTNVSNGAGNGDALPTFSPDGTKVAFLSNRTQPNYDLYTVDPDGNNLFRVTTTSGLGTNGYPHYSPDGTKILVRTISNLYITNTNGTGFTSLTVGYNESFSPDGTKVVFDVGTDIFTININGTNLTNLTNDGNANTYPQYTPDGTKIAFLSDRDDPLQTEVYIMNADGTGQLNISNTPYTDRNNLVFSPDSSTLYFQTDDPDASEKDEIFSVQAGMDNTGDACDCDTDGYCTSLAYCISIEANDLDCNVDTDGDTVLDALDNCPTVPNPGQENMDGPATNLSNSGLASDTEPMFNSDGSKILFLRDNRVFIMDADGTNQSNLTGEGGTHYTARFSPDGTKIVYETDNIDSNSISMMNTDGTGQVQLTMGEYDYAPDVSPDGTKVAFYSSSRDGNDEIYIVNSDGTGEMNLSNNAGTENSPRFTPDGTKIIFTSNRDGNQEIYSMNLDGTNQTNLTNNAAVEFDFSISPDGTKIIFSSDRDGNGEIYVMNIDGTGQTNLTNSPGSFEWNPVYSPDGLKISFYSDRDRNSEIYVMDPDGTNQTNVTNNINYEFNQVGSFSPDGGRIVFETDRDGNYEVYVLAINPDNVGDACDCQTDGICTARTYCIGNSTPDTDCVVDPDGDGIDSDVDNCPTVANPGQENSDGAGATRLTDITSDNSDPVSSPDGRKIIFQSNRDGNAEVYIMNADGSGETNLTNNSATDYNAYFSPDGTKIIFQTDRDGNSEIYTMNVDGTGQTNVTNNAGDDFNPIYTPDGTKIVFLSTRDGNFEIYSMNSDGTAQTNLTNDPATDSQPVITPDGTRIVFVPFRDGNNEIYIMNIDGTGQTNLTNNPSFTDDTPAVSPDGTKIVFNSSRDGNFEIHSMNIDGTGVINLTNNAAMDSDPVISPDGTKIAFFSLRDGNQEIYTMNFDGTAQTNFTNNVNTDEQPTFTSDSRKIIFISDRDDPGNNFAIYSSYLVTDTIGDACDCQIDGLCTATLYCEANLTPDDDCQACPGLGPSETCASTYITSGELSFLNIPANTEFTSAQNNTSLPSYNNATGIDNLDILTVSDLRDDPLSGFEVQLSATPFATPDNLNFIPLQYMYVATSLPRTAGAIEDETEGVEYMAGCGGPTNDITSSVNMPEPVALADYSTLSTFTTYGSSLGTGNVTIPVVLMSAPVAARRCNLQQAISYGVDLPAYITALGTNIPEGTYSTTLTYTLIATTGPSAPRVTFSQPTNGGSIAGSILNVVYTPTSLDTLPAEVDHVHLQLDLAPGCAAGCAGEIRDTDFDGSYQYLGLAPGTHHLEGYLARADHTEIIGTRRAIDFTVTP